MIEPEFLLSPRELDVVWHDLGLGRLPYPLDVPSLGATGEERARLRAEVLAELGEPDPRLVDLLRLLADHRLAVDAVAHLDRPVRAVAASDHRRAVLAVIDSGKVGLLEIRPTALARSIVEVLPDGAPGPGHALSLRLETLNTAVALQQEQDADDDDDPWGGGELDEREALQKAGLSREDATVVSELATSRVAGGQFGVSVGGGYRATRAGVLITWFDTHQGRYLMVHEDGWLSLAPTDNDRIATRIASVLSAVA
ncbi:ESX secretion-associated protein EspG [Saccharothrix australiensis]|uniref:ESAT-6 protein secretion system EspG family protein n=1 Tax=Saccharothrix australiensis TaxID=2072 RepID=A0A495W7W7_9PSEU|nr:ESX secretion-associated protein EspG [Saccharothrix australiensis]RKT57374.1 ESAT-6 protein secretion system EspG family protein [Saccharothrix australiensis]